MNSKKGFTMVELLGVIAIIAAILAFTAPSIVGMLKRDEEKEYNRFLEDLYLATESYVQMKIENYPDLANPGGSYTITVGELIENGYVKASTVNPKTDRKVSLLDTVMISKLADGSYQYQYVVYQE